MDRIDDFLTQRKADGLLRVLKPADSRKDGKIYFDRAELFDFSSNDYLALSDHPRLKEASKQAADSLGVSASASRLLSGDLKIHHQFEDKVAQFKGKESALIFNTGYQANIGIISALYDKGDAVFCDRLIHASIIDAVRQSGAKLFRFNHNDCSHLESLLKKESDKFKNRLIVTETVFSMDGDIPPLKELVEVKDKYGCVLMVDEAHATGIFGPNGAGVVEEQGLSDRIELIMGTFSKALGSFGAYLACSEKVKQYLVNSCRSFIYSTALPPPVIAADIEAIDIVKDEPFRRKTLLANAGFFRTRLREAGFDVKGDSQIVPLIVEDSGRAVRISGDLQKSGFWILPIRPPTVPQGQARLRFSLTYHHNKQLLEKLADRIIEVTQSEK
ncbi:MAG: 8-amino-7-oxononanoate synthase [Phycisphaerae bacterium]|nr:8-amino-7-oxononanoate synthase [Phycisphaerae bacterium]MDD5380975.1 8-amino-7-oxononanoate synthase [Phycisphaerae bacterium]